MRVRLLALALIALCCAPLEVAASSNYMRCAPHPVPPLRDPRLPTPDVRHRRGVVVPSGRFRFRVLGAHVPATPFPDRRRWIRTDYYGALNVTKSANATEIKSKYRRLALQFHPDKLGHLSDRERRVAEENFKIIAEGKEVLTDPGARKEYDDVIDMLPRFARPRHGARSFFDRQPVHFGVLPIVVGCAVVLAVFVSVNQRANQISDRASIIRSRYYQEKYRAAKKKADKRWSVSEEEWFEAFCEQERVIFPSGWRHTFLGRIVALPWTYRNPPKPTGGTWSMEFDEYHIDSDGEDREDAATTKSSKPRRRKNKAAQLRR